MSDDVKRYYIHHVVSTVEGGFVILHKADHQFAEFVTGDELVRATDYAALQQQLAQAQGMVKQVVHESCEVDKALDAAGIDEWDKLPDGTDDEYGCRVPALRIEMLAKERDDCKHRAEQAEGRVKWLEEGYKHHVPMGWMTTDMSDPYSQWKAKEPKP